ncbi:MAG TPA: ComEA family DNA-binding protein [Desulfomonilia bacterium]|nr:ComEA family DNA-binding protein [Desulfomonilia bacterium]
MVKDRMAFWCIVFLLFATCIPLHAAQGVINVNTAIKEEFMMLPGIGGKTAAAIVSYRQLNGPFKAIDDLTRIKGISTKRLDKIRTCLVLKGRNTYIPATFPNRARANPSKPGN